MHKTNVSSYAIAKVAQTSLRAHFCSLRQKSCMKGFDSDGNLGGKARSHRSYLLTACTTAFAGRAEMRSSEAGGTAEQAAPAGVNLKQSGANTNIHAASMSIIAQHTGDIPYSPLHQGTCLTMCGLYRPSILPNPRLSVRYHDSVVGR